MTHKYELPVAKTGDRFFTYHEGEIINEKMWYLDEQNMPQMEYLFDDLQHAQKGEFDGLSEDERAIESMLPRVYAVSKEESDEDILWYEDN